MFIPRFGLFLGLAFLSLSGCSSQPKDASDASVALDFDGAFPISGSLTVRVAAPFDDAGALIPTYVLLGDGKRFAQQAPSDGVVRFVDPSLRGPQDVTVVTLESQTTWHSDGGSSTTASERIETHLGVAQAQVDLRPHPPYQPPEPPPVIGKIEGTVSPCGDGRVALRVLGEGISRANWIGECGSYSLEIRGTKPGPLAVVAQNTCFDYDICWPPLVTPRVGMVSGVAIPETGTARVDVVMDDTFQGSVDLQVQDLPASHTDLSAGILYVFAGGVALDVVGDEASPLQVPVPRKGGPFDSLERWAWVGYQDSGQYVNAAAPLGEPPVIRMPTAPELLEPAGASSTPPPEVARADLRIRWKCSTAGEARLWLTNSQGLSWTVVGACPEGAFTPFELPSLVPQQHRSLPAGDYGVQLTAYAPRSPIGPSSIRSASGSFTLR